jgi:serine/threonine-protein kinase
MMSCGCPDNEQLSAYVCGKLDLGTHALIDGHLDECTDCLAAVEALDDRTAPPFPPMAPTAAAPEDSAFRQLVARVKALGRGSPVVPPCTTAQFVERLSRSGLLSPGDIESMPALRPGAREATPLAEELVACGKLTGYQADELLRGSADGLVLGNYVLREPIGAGGMGQVFKAEHRRMKRLVALKVLAPGLLGPAARARFQREIETAARLAHPNVVVAHDAGEAGGRHFLVMEYVDGCNLAALGRQGPLPIRQALEYVRQAARGLAHAHAAGTVHRDIKPANLLVDGDGIVKVLDLGLARMVGAGDESGGEDLTSSGAVMGTAAFMAPEQAADAHAADHRADIYSLGCTLYYLLTGKPPYEGKGALEVVLAHRERPIPSLRAARPDCPPEVEAFYRRLVAKRPEDRPPSMEAVADELGRLLGDGTAGESPTGRLNFPASRGTRRMWWLAAAGILLAASVLLAWISTRPTAATPRGPADSRPDLLAASDSHPDTPSVVVGPANIPAPPTGKAEAPPTGKAEVPKTPVVEVVLVRAGEFQMGSDEHDPEARDGEKPRHPVRINQAFYLGKTPVTQAQYREVMGSNPSAFAPQGLYKQRVAGINTDRYPVESVTWLDAVHFCNRLSEPHGLPPYYRIDGNTVTVRGGSGYRLPTEAEWEYACRAGSTKRWSFGDSPAELGKYAWYAGNSGDTTHPVGLKEPNAWGLYDMHGNVREWCWDRYGADYYKHSPASDPTGPGTGNDRVYRGGSWNDRAPQTRAAAREPLGIGYGILTPVGLRVARNTESGAGLPINARNPSGPRDALPFWITAAAGGRPERRAVGFSFPCSRGTGPCEPTCSQKCCPRWRCWCCAPLSAAPTTRRRPSRLPSSSPAT